MDDRLPVELVLHGEPFDEGAVRHTLRHLAMRAGWTLVPSSPYRVIYAAVDGSRPANAATDAIPPVLVPTDATVAAHLSTARTPIPVARRADGTVVPFPQRVPTDLGWVDGDVIAGAHACLNLWYEQRTGPAAADGWITYEQDWWTGMGLPDPLPLADQWLERICEAAVAVGWPDRRPVRRTTLVLTHDVDYLPGRWDRGFPRFARALYRQLVLRRRPADALRLCARYLGAHERTRPYFDIPTTVAEERRRGARSSFQFVVTRRHPADPRYADGPPPLAAVPEEWETCLHGSYLAARTAGQLRSERARLEALIGRSVRGHRQHYLNLTPQSFFRAVDEAAFEYDMSIGYNDRSGPRAGTYFPFRPYDLQRRRAHGFWEVPFVLMDTTLATTYRFSPAEAIAHARAVLEPVVAAGGCTAIIWHQEQCGGLLDPGYERVYFELLDWLGAVGARLVPGRDVLPELESAWTAAASEPCT